MSAINALEKVQRTDTLTVQTYSEIKKLLMTGKLQPGEKLTGRQIAKAMNVSLTPSREAIGRLVAEGALTPGINQGAFVTRLTCEMFKEISECRVLLEGQLAYHSISNFRDEDTKKIKKTVEKMEDEKNKSNYSELLHLNTEFHFKIYNIANMPIMLSIVESLWLKIGPTLNLLRPFYQESNHGIDFHKNFIHYLEKNDPYRAKKAIIQDISLATKRISKLLKNRK